LIVHLDTNFLIRSLVIATPEAALLGEWLQSRNTVSISVVCWTEFLCGPLTPEQQELASQTLGDPVPFVSADAMQAAQLFNLSGRRRGTLMDCMIAAVAIGADAAMATANTADFLRFEALGLKLIHY